jgi:hypothetical protein
VNSLYKSKRALTRGGFACTVMLIGACSASESPNGRILGPGAAATSALVRPRFGPPPHPYNPAVDGPPRANSTPELNVASRLRRDVPMHGSGFGRGPRNTPPVYQSGGTDAHRGWWVNVGRGIESDFTDVGFQIQPPYSATSNYPLSIPSSWTQGLLYAPTTVPNGGSCIEVSMIHWHGNYWNGPDHAFGVWDWCNRPNGGFQLLEDMSDPTWQANYMTDHIMEGTGTNEETAAIAIVADNPNAATFSNDCWNAMLWNKRTQAWEIKYRSCGVSAISAYVPSGQGWSMHESEKMQGYYSSTCVAIPSLGAEALWALSGSTSIKLTPPSSGDGYTSYLGNDGACFANNSYSFMNLPNDNGWWGWQALTPTSAFF